MIPEGKSKWKRLKNEHVKSHPRLAGDGAFASLFTNTGSGDGALGDFAGFLAVMKQKNRQNKQCTSSELDTVCRTPAHLGGAFSFSESTSLGPCVSARITIARIVVELSNKRVSAVSVQEGKSNAD